MFINKLFDIISFLFWCIFYPIAIDYYAYKKGTGIFDSIGFFIETVREQWFLIQEKISR